MTEYYLDQLSNKTKVLLAPLKETEAVTVLVLVKVGSRYESANLGGISHFIEHLLFKGTKKRPTSLDISKELDGVGADYNAFTGKDHTGYYIKVNHDKLELAMDIVSDMLFNSVFSKEEIDKERGVIIEEINMYDDNPMILIGSLLEECIFYKHPLGRDVSGSKENIQKISRSQIVKYFNNNYIGNNIIVGVAGKFNKQKAKNLINKYFNRQIFKSSTSSFKTFASQQKKPRIVLKTKETEQVHIALGYPAYKIDDPRIYSLSLLATILGGNMSSRLFLEIREKLGLAYFIKMGISSYQDCGVLAVYAGLDKAKIKLALKTIIKELKKTVNSKVTKEELSRAKEYIKGKLILRLEDSTQLIEWLAGQKLLKGKIDDLDEQIKKLEKVSLDQVQRTAKEVIKSNKVNLGIIGPYTKQKSFLNILQS
ncbi:insulinase family protein [Patescibacteria group bacterium]|nr:insulinase family protein [Patescibacteria group bacterium]